MGDIETVKIKHDGERGYAIINKSDFDAKKHEPFDDSSREAVADLVSASDGSVRGISLIEADEERRRYEANRGVPSGSTAIADGKNPSGTFSEPTPTDIRYPNKDETEFENNHGAFIGKSAAQMREDKGLPDAPGGLAPDAEHVGKGPRGKWYVKKGTVRTAGPFETEEEAKAAMTSDDTADSEQSVERSDEVQG